MVKENKKLARLSDTGLSWIVDGVSAILVAEVKQWLNGNVGYTLRNNVVIEPAGEGLVVPRIGFASVGQPMGEADAKRNLQIVTDELEGLESLVKNSEEYLASERVISEIKRLINKLREELAIIRLRRIVSGRCKYCPL